MEENRTEEMAEKTASADNGNAAPAEMKQSTKATPKNMALLIGAIVVVIAVIIALLAGTFGGAGAEDAVASDPAEMNGETVPATIPADGNPDDETCKGTYTASDEEVKAAADVVVATAGEYELTNSELQVYYWLGVQSFLQNCSYYSNSYGFDYAAMIGLDYTKPFDTQICNMVENGATWQQFFLLNAVDSWHYYQSLQAEAIKAGFDVTADKREFLDNLDKSIAEDAVNYGFESAEDYLAYNAGPGATMESYKEFMEQNYRGYDYFESLVNALELTDAELEEYYTENEAAFLEQKIGKDARFVDVRHILIEPTAEEGTGTISDEAWAACEAKAQEVLETWKSGAADEESFAELAKTETQDPGSKDNGGLYTQVYVGQMVPEFEAWCFDESRAAGDTGLVKTTYGYHIMYFVQSYPSMQWKTAAESALREIRSEEMMMEIAQKYPLEVDYSKVVLGYLNLAEEPGAAAEAEEVRSVSAVPVLIVGGISMAALLATALYLKKKEH